MGPDTRLLAESFAEAVRQRNRALRLAVTLEQQVNELTERMITARALLPQLAEHGCDDPDDDQDDGVVVELGRRRPCVRCNIAALLESEWVVNPLGVDRLWDAIRNVADHDIDDTDPAEPPTTIGAVQ